MKHKPINLTVLILIAILAALSAVLMTINIPLPFAPTFLKFDITEYQHCADIGNAVGNKSYKSAIMNRT